MTQWQEVRVTTSGTLPGGLTAEKYYYVQTVDANSFKLVEYRGSPDAIEMTSNGTGTHKVDPEEGSWASTPAVVGAATEAYLTDVQDGVDYDFRIRFKNAMGNVGEYATVAAHTVVGKTAAPGVPTGVSASFDGSAGTIYPILTWTNATDTDFSHVEIQDTVDSGSNWDNLVGDLKSTGFYARSQPFTYGSSDSYQFRVRSVDTTGNVSAWVTSSEITA